MVFVVDENIPYHAVGHIDETEASNEDAAIFIATLVTRKHQIGISDKLYAKYNEALDYKMRERLEFIDDRMVAIIRNLISNSELRVIASYPIPKLEVIEPIKSDDAFIVELALHLNCNVVTHDVPLYNAIKKRNDLAVDSLRASKATALM